MSKVLLILVSGALVNNVVLSRFLGLCSFVGVSKKTDTSTGMGGAVIFVIFLATILASVVYACVLKPFGIDYLQTIVFILLIASLVQFIEMFTRRGSGQRAEGVQLHRGSCVGYRYCGRLRDRHCDSGGHPREM